MQRYFVGKGYYRVWSTVCTKAPKDLGSVGFLNTPLGQASATSSHEHRAVAQEVASGKLTLMSSVRLRRTCRKLRAPFETIRLLGSEPTEPHTQWGVVGMLLPGQYCHAKRALDQQSLVSQLLPRSAQSNHLLQVIPSAVSLYEAYLARHVCRALRCLNHPSAPTPTTRSHGKSC
jgi:hypothetical protein